MNQNAINDIVDRLPYLSSQDLEAINLAVIREGGRRGWHMANVEPVADAKDGQTVRVARIALPVLGLGLN